LPPDHSPSSVSLPISIVVNGFGDQHMSAQLILLLDSSLNLLPFLEHYSKVQSEFLHAGHEYIAIVSHGIYCHQRKYRVLQSILFASEKVSHQSCSNEQVKYHLDEPMLGPR
jgi:hypothetical protein